MGTRPEVPTLTRKKEGGEEEVGSRGDGAEQRAGEAVTAPNAAAAL